MMRLRCLIAAALLLPGSLFGQASLKGKVVDGTSGEPVVYASIVVYNVADSAMVDGIVSGADGNFAIEKLRAGHYYAVASFMGYVPVTVDLTLSDRETKDHGTLLLTPSERM